jgi:hypothetical protein
MDKERTVLAKGNVRDRHLVDLADTKDQKRILTYTTPGRARGAFKNYGFYDEPDEDYELEAVKVEITIREV